MKKLQWKSPKTAAVITAALLFVILSVVFADCNAESSIAIGLVFYLSIRKTYVGKQNGLSA